MGSPSWVIPVAALSTICGVGFIGVWFWFPRLLRKGTQQELQVLATERAERDRYLQQRRAEEGKVVQETQVTSAPKDVPEAA
ncbi:uncharacterized protein TrAtP1_002678 [Trichoderma atroviride]|uniref:Uncharacterized protein n=1 Tax=Hypocrea atroviridis (strain ATCC 20476 / IMI 206040) TaxID=452589 RepID=G9NE15_HYPAI|nr:uncharacterized protein TRIATDRAFT_55004 [Trichoderma atroviride IMI 206040]EHK51096.1 hypothetical protein TRIATDRAFT_55004 [Trichoderma atroviride IMI 206040]UKZ61413.1 hypothetical protein TrAtP1_002678 [Trichoderma atroviride]